MGICIFYVLTHTCGHPIKNIHIFFKCRDEGGFGTNPELVFEWFPPKSLYKVSVGVPNTIPMLTISKQFFYYKY